MPVDKPVLAGKRLIEDAIPIAAINVVAQREKIGHAATHPRKLHLWWARRPLAAARAAVYAALVPAEGRDRTPAEEAAFFDSLCRWGGPESAIRQARDEVLQANGGVAPKVVDMFAGGGAIPLEAARLGCEVTAIELNPVAHLIERVMLEFPQRHPDLAADVRRWGTVWVDRAWEQLADLYPPVGPGTGQQTLGGNRENGRRPLAYLWTRTVRCPNPALPEHRVDLVRQTWLARKKGRAIALRAVVDRAALTVRYEVVEATSASALGFDPGEGSRRGQATCRVCGATVTADYVKAEGRAGRMGIAPLAAVVLKSSGRGRDYLPVGTYPLPDDDECARRLAELPVDAPTEMLVRELQPSNHCAAVRAYPIPRPLHAAAAADAMHSRGRHREVYEEMRTEAMTGSSRGCCDVPRARARSRCRPQFSPVPLGCRQRDRDEYVCAPGACRWSGTSLRPAPFGGAAGDVPEMVSNVADIVETLAAGPSQLRPVVRGSATSLPLPDASQDAVITDPPYYDNISYADLSDFFYVWLKRSVGFLYPDDFGGELTPKRSEAVVCLRTVTLAVGRRPRSSTNQTDGRRLRRGASGA